MSLGEWTSPRGAGARCAAVAVCAVALPALAQVYPGNPNNLPIPDPGSTTNTIHVDGGPASITSVRVVVLVRHPWDADVQMALVRGSTYLRLTSDLGGSGANYYLTRFSDDAPTSISAGQAPFVGLYRPLGGVLTPDASATDPLPPTALPNLAAFNGQDAIGDWTLWVADDDALLSGNLQYWSLEFNGGHDASGDPMPPTNFVDLGTADQANTGVSNIPLATGEVKFFKLVLPMDVTAPTYLDLDTVGSSLPETEPGISNDTYMFLFDNQGVQSVHNDDGGPGFTSMLSFGAGSGQTIGDASDPSGGVAGGQAGNLSAGTYWLAVSGYRMDVDTGWVVDTTCTVAGTLAVRMRTNITSGPVCGSPDFNHDGDSSTDADIEDFFRCLAGNCCPTCDSADFNGDGDSATDADIEAFFRVLAGGNC